MPYSSDINLGLGEIPKTTDPAIFPDMVDIYNAIHILGQAVDIVSKKGSNNDSTVDPWDAMPFKDWIWVTAAQDITTGQVVTIVDDNAPVYPAGGSPVTIKGAVPGAGSVSRSNVYGSFFPARTITGVALADAITGTKLKFGIGPAVVKVPGVKAGTIIYGRAVYMNPTGGVGQGWLRFDGTMYSSPPDGAKCIIGLGVADDAVMFNAPNLSGILSTPQP